jgi:hypothetical protein
MQSKARNVKMDFSEIIPSLSGKDLYIYMTQENPDWTLDDSRVEMIIHCDGKKFVLPLSDAREVSYLASSLHHFIGGGSLILSWCAKDIFSFLKGKTGIALECSGNIYDLSVVSSYFGYPKQKPASFKDALSVIRNASGESGWKDFRKFYDKVYMPLISEVVPSMETCCLVDNKRRRCVYPSYVIEGQANGRLKAVKSGLSSYNPHSLGPDERKSIRPSGYDQSFVYFDFRNMEVCVLRWLSSDEGLGRIIDSGADPYREIWKIMAGSDPSDSQRVLCKSVFLPVVFGLGRSSLAKKIGVSEKVAGLIIDRLVKSFPVAFEWVDRQEDFDGDFAIDVFGRRRAFESGESYKARNFCVQAPASMICLRKLVSLHEGLIGLADICHHVHDGYCLVCDRSSVEEVANAGLTILQSEDDLFPGLSLRASCQFGPDLNNLETLRKVQFS